MEDPGYYILQDDVPADGVQNGINSACKSIVICVQIPRIKNTIPCDTMNRGEYKSNALVVSALKRDFHE